jgi:colanic acid biosynthesis glycosyl transferase WcaI
LRILLHGINYSPELTGIGKYTGEMAEWLSNRGHEVRVVTAPPYYPAWRVRADYPAWKYSTEHTQIKVYRCPLFVPEQPSAVSRLAHLLSFTLSSLPVMLSQIAWQPDVVVTVEPAFFCTFNTLLTAKLSGAARWLHVQDFEIDAAFDMGFLHEGGGVSRLTYGLERAIMQRFDRVSTVSPRMVTQLEQKGVERKNALLFPNWVDISVVHPMEKTSALRTKLALGAGKVVLLYSGNMGMKQGLELLPVLAQWFVPDPRVHFIFCGDGAMRPQLEQAVAGLSNVTMLPLQPASSLNDLLNAADVHLLPQRADAADLVMPSKLTGMLASGRPVIATAAKGTQVATAIQGCGIAVEPGDMAGVIDAVSTLVGSAALRREMGVNARIHAVEHLGKDRVLERFEQQLRELTGRR